MWLVKMTYSDDIRELERCCYVLLKGVCYTNQPRVVRSKSIYITNIALQHVSSYWMKRDIEVFGCVKIATI